MSTASLARVSAIARDHLASIAALFAPGAKATLLIRSPVAADGSRDFVLTDDELPEAIAALLKRLPDRDPVPPAEGSATGYARALQALDRATRCWFTAECATISEHSGSIQADKRALFGTVNDLRLSAGLPALDAAVADDHGLLAEDVT